MEELLKVIANHVALAVETVAVLIVAFGAAHALIAILSRSYARSAPRLAAGTSGSVSAAGVARGLQFALAADIVRSAISPTWEQIGQLAAIAAIRTFLSYFLERDLMEVQRREAEAGLRPERRSRQNL